MLKTTAKNNPKWIQIKHEEVDKCLRKIHRESVALVCTYQKLPIFLKKAKPLLIIFSDSLQSINIKTMNFLLGAK